MIFLIVWHRCWMGSPNEGTDRDARLRTLLPQITRLDTMKIKPKTVDKTREEEEEISTRAHLDNYSSRAHPHSPSTTRTPQLVGAAAPSLGWGMAEHFIFIATDGATYTQSRYQLPTPNNYCTSANYRQCSLLPTYTDRAPTAPVCVCVRERERDYVQRFFP
jgi:hypothetical protein